MASGGIGNQSPATLFQARLRTTAISGVTLSLDRYQGNKVVVSGVPVIIPLAGLDRDVADNLIDATGADAGAPPAANTLYYVYISNSRAAFSPQSIRLSATAPSFVGGVKYLGTSGDALNWRFVGWVQLNGIPEFESTVTSRLIINQYNRQRLDMFLCPGYVDDNAPTLYTINSATWRELNFYVGSGLGRLSFISNGEDAVQYESKFQFEQTITEASGGGVGEDSVTTPAIQCLMIVAPDDSVSAGRAVLFSEGTHYLAMLAMESSGAPEFVADLGRQGGAAVDVPTTYISATVDG